VFNLAEFGNEWGESVVDVVVDSIARAWVGSGAGRRRLGRIWLCGRF